MNAPVTIKGWCPSAQRPMRSGDGLLVRVRAQAGGLDAEQVRALARAATRFGNGHIDLTARANLQVRGVGDALWPDLLDALVEARLLDGGDAAAAPINILLPPLAGLDPSARLDARALATAIESGLRADPAFAELPSKFGFAIDDGGVLAPGDLDADIALAACLLPDGATGVVLRIASGDESVCVPARDAAAAALRLAHAFLDLRQGERRMRALVERVGLTRVLTQAGLAAERDPVGASRAPAGRSLLGASVIGGLSVLGVAAPFGAWTADGFEALADALDACSGASLRVTPWRIMLLTGLSSSAAQDAAVSFAARDLIVTPHDPRLAVAACTGAPGCASASVVTRSLAQNLSTLLPDRREGIILHVSGCVKGCAHPHGAPLTLVGREGRFDLVADGQPGDAPEVHDIEASATFATVQGRFAP